MHIAFRADSSDIIGHGHIMRCLTLAHALVAQVTREQSSLKTEIQISFLCKDHLNNINHLIEQTAFALLRLPRGKQTVVQQDSQTWLSCKQDQDAQQCIKAIQARKTQPIDILVVDHYALDEQWHKLLKPYSQQLMVIDDLASRSLSCDLLLDQTLNRTPKQYQSLVPRYCQLLLGQKYMLLRNEFSELKEQAKKQRQLRNKELLKANFLISMGGGDPDNLSELALLAIAQLHSYHPNLSATIIISSQSKHREALSQLSYSFTWCTLITDCSNMAEMMLNADIAIGASGATAWERCCLGLPTLTTVNAKNQQLVAKNLAESGTSINLGWHQELNIEKIIKELNTLLSDPKTYLAMVENSFKCCDGLGASRVAQAIIECINRQ